MSRIKLNVAYHFDRPIYQASLIEKEKPEGKVIKNDKEREKKKNFMSKFH